MATRPAKRARISLACTSCREHKTRCDGEQPRCGCCQWRTPGSQDPCVYRNQAKAKESKEIQSLLQRINELEGRLPVEEQQPEALATTSSDSHGQSSSPRPQAAEAFAIPKSAGHGGRASVSERQSSPLPRPNGDLQRQPVSRPIFSPVRSGSEHSRRQDPVSLRNFSISNDQYASTNETTSRMPPVAGCGPSRSHMSNTEGGTQQLQGIFHSGPEPDILNDDAHGVGAATPQANNEPYFYGGSSNTTLMQEVHDIISPSTRGDQSSNADHSRREPSVYSAPETSQRREDNIRDLHSNNLSFRNYSSHFELPPRSFADHLLSSYFHRVHIYNPFLHRQTFEAAYERLWTGEKAKPGDDSGGGLIRLSDAGLGNSVDSGPESRVFYAAINAIFALSSQFSDLPISKAMEAAKLYLERAMALLFTAKLVDHPTVSVVQVLLLLSLHLQGTPLRNRLWNVVGMAFRMAQGLGLQAEDGEGYVDGKAKTGLEVEMRRRVWYSCVMLEMTVSMTLGRPGMTGNPYSTPFPRAIDDEHLWPSTPSSSPDFVQPQVGISLTSFFVEAIKLWQLTEKVMRALYSKTGAERRVHSVGPGKGEDYPQGGFDVLMELETEWTKLYVNLPSELRWPNGGANASNPPPSGSMAATEAKQKWLEGQKNVLHTRFLYVKLLIYRPLFLRVYRDRVPPRIEGTHNQEPPIQELPTRLSSWSEDLPPTIQSHFASRFSTECFQAADELLTLVHMLHLTKGANAWWYSIFYAYFTGIVIVLTRFCPPLTEMLGIARVDRSWALCQEVLKDMTVYGSHAEKCLASLQDLYSRLQAAWESGYTHKLQNVPTVVDRSSNDQSNWNVYEQNAAANHMYDPTLYAGRESRNEMPVPFGNLGFVPMDDWAGPLPWDTNLNNWGSFDPVGGDFGMVSTLEPTYY